MEGFAYDRFKFSWVIGRQLPRGRELSTRDISLGKSVFFHTPFLLLISQFPTHYEVKRLFCHKFPSPRCSVLEYGPQDHPLNPLKLGTKIKRNLSSFPLVCVRQYSGHRRETGKEAFRGLETLDTGFREADISILWGEYLPVFGLGQSHRPLVGKQTLLSG